MKERGGALLIWTFVQLLATIASAFAMGSVMRNSMGAMMAGASQEAVQASYGLQSFLVGLISLVVGTIISAAVQRSVLRPAEGGPGWLRLGADELRLFGLLLLYVIVFALAFVVLGVVVGLTAGTSAQALTLLLTVGMIAAISYFGTKLSLTFPLTLKRGAFAIGDGWALTKGHFWTLFVTYFIVFIALMIVGFLIVVVSEPDYIAAISQYGILSPEAEQASMAPYLRLMDGTIDAPMIINWVLVSIQGAVSYVLLGGAAATAVLELDGAEEGLSETFS